jgi:dTDP-4-dehydrorhamnose 3,5-epimerase
MAVGKEIAFLANCATIPHDPSEVERLDSFSNKIPYHWEAKNGK